MINPPTCTNCGKKITSYVNLVTYPIGGKDRHFHTGACAIKGRIGKNLIDNDEFPITRLLESPTRVPAWVYTTVYAMLFVTWGVLLAILTALVL